MKKLTLLVVEFLFVSVFISYGQITVELQPHATEGKDAKVNSLNLWDPGLSQEFIANAWTFGGTPGEVRSFIEFDLTFIPDSVQIQDARLCLYTAQPMPSGNHSQLTGSNECWLRRVTEAWSEENILWETQPAATEEGQIYIPASSHSLQDYEIDVTDMVQDMVAYPDNNHGFMIILQLEEHYRRMNFASSDHPDSSAHPKLIVTYDEAPASNDLLLYYPIEGNANDASGNGFHGLPSGCTLTVDRCGNINSAYDLDGNDDYIELPNDNMLKPQFPISVTSWVYIDEFPENINRGIFTNDFLEDYYTGVWISCLSSERIGIGYGNGGIVSPASRRNKATTVDINTGEWFHISAVFLAPNDMKIYINAIEDTGTYHGGNTNPDIAYSDQAGRIGAKDCNVVTKYFDGKIDELTYWHKALSALEIDSIYNAIQNQPIAGFDYTKDELTVTFENFSVNAIDYEWDFGDGETSTEKHPVHSYKSQGYYITSLIVSNNCNSDTIIDTVLVCPDVQSDFYYTADSTIAYFRNLAANADTFYWDFGDGNYSSELNPEYDYQKNGKYYACLIAANLCGIDIFCDSVIICEPPNTAFSANINLYDVYFTNMTDTAISFYWEFGDGHISTEKDPVHTYDSIGYYNVCLTAFNECGSEMFCDSIYLAPLPLSNFSVSYEKGVFLFHNLSNSVLGCFWDFGDGNTSNEMHPIHQYENAGTYKICLTIENELGFYTSCDSLKVETGTNIEEYTIFPNPATNLITITQNIKKNTFVKIFNIKGQLMQSYQTCEKLSKLDISDLPRGFYLIKITSDVLSDQKRLIKQ
ncbi:MAG: PKD domain-containing protein [Bacteroidales bacterium]|nr:PKD domain-containing protein [Bacteroidales bacterium]MCF8386381.1 PKD domain-containing protein [Bacteroidales bacterium]MCF8396777.1 PKD domain-containing protein [Bacteroidales bacterium]